MTQLIVKEESKISTWTPEQVALIKKTIAHNATDDELKMFLQYAAKTGLDPLSRQIYFNKRGGKAVFVTSIDGYRLIAARTGEHAGTDDTVFDNEKEPNKATTTVYRIVQGQKVAFTASARWDEYCPTEGADHMWQKMPCTMLGKCSEGLALRKAFPNELSGTYTKEEMDQAGDEPVLVQKPQVSRPQHNSLSSINKSPVTESKAVHIVSPPVTDAQKKMVWAKIKNELKLSDDEAKTFLRSTTHKEHSLEWTKDDLEKVLSKIEGIKASNPQIQNSIVEGFEPPVQEMPEMFEP